MEEQSYRSKQTMKLNMASKGGERVIEELKIKEELKNKKYH